jgi:hypothetical protein
MSRNTLFLEDVLGAGWENEVGEEARIEPRAEVVRGLTASRYRQLWQLYPSAPHNDVLRHLGAGLALKEAAEATGLSERQVKNLLAQFLAQAAEAVTQRTFLPPPRPVATSLHIERRPRSRRGRPPKDRKALPTPQAQVGLPF